MSLQYEKSDENEQQITPEEFLQQQKKAIRRRAFWFIGFGVLIIILHFLAVFIQAIKVRDLFRSIFFILGLFVFVGGIWGIYYAKKLTLQDLIPTPEAVEFLRQARDAKSYFSYILVGLIVVVTLFQLKTETVDSLFLIGEQSAEIVGLVKPAVWQGEYWRLLTYATLHGFFLCIYILTRRHFMVLAV